ncbi:MAG: hypothetical protein IJ842_02525 [Bacilli bacterium]|nr:hypothetical protein [Bacilli bacterium]
MKKLNNKGITTIEVIICFLLVVIIATSMYTTVSAFNERRIIEQYKEEIYSYKNILTKQIQDDFIKIGITSAKITTPKQTDETPTYTLEVTLRDGTKRRLIIIQQLGYSIYHLGGEKNTSDKFMIKYGKVGEEIEYPIPDLGEFHVDSSGKRKNCTGGSGCLTIKDLSINNVYLNVEKDQVLTIYIGFYHPELSTRYAISIVAPLNYVISSNNNEDPLFKISTPVNPTPDPSPSTLSCTITPKGTKKDGWYTSNIDLEVTVNGNYTSIETKDSKGEKYSDSEGSFSYTQDTPKISFTTTVRNGDTVATCSTAELKRDTTPPKLAVALKDYNQLTEASCSAAIAADDRGIDCISGKFYKNIANNTVPNDLVYSGSTQLKKNQVLWYVAAVDLINISESVNQARSGSGFGSGIDTNSIKWKTSATGQYKDISSSIVLYKIENSSPKKFVAANTFSQSGNRELTFKACDILGNCKETKIIATIND